MTRDQLATLHHRAVKAAQVHEAATPGTRDKERKHVAWQRAEKAFANALDSIRDTA